MLPGTEIKKLLTAFQIELTSPQLAQLMSYLGVLLKWNRKINLTSVRSAEECVTRHFGESLHVARYVQLRGTLLDIGSGAGFPGLVLKIVFPELTTTLLEPVAKKRAFLKEVVRVCQMQAVEVRGERIEDYIRHVSPVGFSSVTSRAVGSLTRLVGLAAECLVAEGRLILWLGRTASDKLEEIGAAIDWEPPIALPLARERVIRIGTRKAPPIKEKE